MNLFLHKKRLPKPAPNSQRNPTVDFPRQNLKKGSSKHPSKGFYVNGKVLEIYPLAIKLELRDMFS